MDDMRIEDTRQPEDMQGKWKQAWEEKVEREIADASKCLDQDHRWYTHIDSICQMFENGLEVTRQTAEELFPELYAARQAVEELMEVL